MGPRSVVTKPVPGERAGTLVEYTFTFDRWYCGWDALRLDAFEGLRFPENNRFAWCGPALGLTPSNHREDRETIIALPCQADRVVLHGHQANEHYGFPGAEDPIQVLDARGGILAEGFLEPWFKRLRRGLSLAGPGITRIRIPTSKPVFFLRKLQVYYPPE